MAERGPSPESGARGQESAPRPRALLSDWRFHLLAIAALALIPRIIYLAQIYHSPFFYYPILDSRTQNIWAETLVRTLGIGNNEVVAKPPLYSYFLALSKVAVGSGGPSLFAARLVQLILGALTCGLTYLIGRRVFGLAAGIIAGLILACYSPAIFGEGELLDTALATFLAAAFLLALLATLDKPTAPRWFGVGLLLGLLGLTRGNLLLLAPLALLLLFLWLRNTPAREELARMAGVFLLGVVLPIASITFRNAILMHAFIPISTNGGINFYTGNNPSADGYSPIPSGSAWESTWYQAKQGGALTPAEQDRFWRTKALSFLFGQPGKALALYVKKLYLYWGGYEIPNNLSYDWGRARASLLRVVPLTFALVGPLALLGLGLGARRNRGAKTLTWVIAVQVLAVILFFVCGRYRMPALPALSVFAGFALVELTRLARRREWKTGGLALVGLAAAAALVNADPYGVGRARAANRDWYYLAQSYAEQGDITQARRAAERAARQDPDDPDAWFLAGNMANQQGDAQAARERLRRALEAAPDFTRAASRLATISLNQGWPLEEPKRLLARALDAQEGHVNGLASLVRINVRLGEREEAEENLTRLGQALARWDPRDTRFPATRAEAQLAATEASSAGIAVPQILSPEPDWSARPLGSVRY